MSTVGASGDYTTIQACLDDIDAGGDGVCQIIDNAEFDEELSYDESGSCTLTVASGVRHDGTAGSGARVVPPASPTAGGQMLDINSGNLDVEWLEFDGEGENYSSIIRLDDGANTIARCILHDIDGNGAFTPGAIYKLTNDECNIVRNIIYDIDRSSQGNRSSAGIYDFAGGVRHVNAIGNTIGRITHAGSSGWAIQITNSGSNKYFRNNVGFGCDSDDMISGTGCDNDYNASEDTSADQTNDVTNIDPSTEFVDYSATVPDLHLDSTASDLIDSGEDQAGDLLDSEIDIDGRDVDAEGDTWDIGADEYVSAGGTTITVGLATETDSAFAATGLKTRSIGLATSNESALAASLFKTLTVGLATEADSALAATHTRTIPIGLATETDSALALVLAKTISVGLATSNESALPVTINRTLAVGLALETDSALAATWSKLVQIGLAVETDTALAVSVAGGGAQPRRAGRFDDGAFSH